MFGFQIEPKQAAAEQPAAVDLLATLPAVLSDDDEGLDEAIRRSRELDENPEIGLSGRS